MAAARGVINRAALNRVWGPISADSAVAQRLSFAKHFSTREKTTLKR